MGAYVTGRGRIILLPGVRRVWRSADELQIGADPARAVVVSLPDAAAARVLDLLDGARTERAVIREASRHGVRATHAAALVATLREAGLVLRVDALLPPRLAEPARRRLLGEATALALARRRPVDGPVARARRTGHAASGGSGGGHPVGTPAESIERRAAASVRVAGPARLAVPLAAVLARAGVGRVHTVVTGRVGVHDDAPGGLLAADERRPRFTAAGEAVRRAAPCVDTRSVPLGRTTFVVLADVRIPPRLLAASYARRRQPYLLVDVRDDTVVVGPLVVPGRGPCVNCLDLHRRDRDPAWPAIAAQLSTAIGEAPTTGVATTLTAVGIGAAQVLAHLDGGVAATVGATLEIGPDAQVKRRPWAVHPRCDCVSGIAPGSGRSARDSPDEVQLPT